MDKYYLGRNLHTEFTYGAIDHDNEHNHTVFNFGKEAGVRNNPNVTHVTIGEDRSVELEERIILSIRPIEVPLGYINIYPTDDTDEPSIVSLDKLLDVANGDEAYGYTIDVNNYTQEVLSESHFVNTVNVTPSILPVKKYSNKSATEEDSDGNATKITLVKDDKELNEVMFTYEGNVEFFDTPEHLDEITKLKEELVPLYVLLIRSNSTTSKIIGKATNGEFTHASISLDSSLNKLYSFAVNGVDPSQPKEKQKLFAINKGGFKEETLSGLQQLGDIPYALYILPIRKRNLDKVKKRLNYFIVNKSIFSYDAVALGKAFFNIADDSSETKFFCSRFVADILNTGSDIPLVDHPSLVRPDDFKFITGTRYVCSGSILEYSKHNVEKISDRIIRDYDITRDYVSDNIVQVRNNALSTKERLDQKVASFIFSRQRSSGELVVNEASLGPALRHFKAFKIQLSPNGDVVINKRVCDDLEKQYTRSVQTIRRCRSAGDVTGIKDELCKIHYMVGLIDDNYLTPHKDTNAKAIRDLRAKLLSAYTTELRHIKDVENDFNFNEYYANSIYTTQTIIPAKVIANGVKYVSTLL